MFSSYLWPAKKQTTLTTLHKKSIYFRQVQKKNEPEMVHLIDAPEDPFIKNRYSMLKKQVQQDYIQGYQS